MTHNQGFNQSEENLHASDPQIVAELPKGRTNKSIENAELAQESIVENKKVKCRVMKNVLLIGSSWILLFTAFQSIANLQSSLNSDSGLGTASLATIYVSLIFGSILLPTTMMEKLTIKWTIIVSQCAFILYIAANLYAKYWTLIPAAIILGLGAAPLWSAKCVFLTDLGTFYSKHSRETPEVIISRFFGIFFAMFQSSNVWGNLISYTVLRPTSVDNSTLKNTNFSFCGIHDCPSNGGGEIRKPELTTVYTLCGIYITLAILAVALLSFFLDSYKTIGLESNEKNSKKSPISMLINTLRHIKNPNQLLIIPLTLYSGFEQAYIGADFTKSFISCINGIESVGLVMICFGVADTLGSYFFGFLTKFVGRIPIFICAAVLNYVTIMIMLFWVPTAETKFLLYIIAILWGLSDAVWQTQINAFYGVIFKSEEEAAFSNYRLWESLGFAIAYAYSSYLCTNVKLFLLIGYLTVGMLGYGTIEYRERMKIKAIITPF